MSQDAIFRRRADELLQQASATGDDWGKRSHLINQAVYWQGLADNVEARAGPAARYRELATTVGPVRPSSTSAG